MRTPSAPPLADDLEALLRRLRLPHIRRAAPEVLATAKAQRWEPAEVLRSLLGEELAGRERSALQTRRKAASFPTGKTFEAWEPKASSIPAPTQQALRTLEWVRRRENLVVCGPSGTGKTFFLEAIGQTAVEVGIKVAWFALEDLGVLVRRHRADDTVTRAVGRILRSELIVVDLCRLRDYADTAASVTLKACRRWPSCIGRDQRARHSYSASRNARRVSPGLKRPGTADVGVVSSRARCLMVMSACR